MRVERLGEGAVILYDFSWPSHRLAHALEGLPGCRDVVPSYETVGLYFTPGALSLAQIQEFTDGLGRLDEADEGLEHRIPVCYELGEDNRDCAERLRIDRDDLIQAHCGSHYKCYAIGFTPGFPYLGYLPPELSGLPRRAEPRVQVPKGSVAITGRQTGIYPGEGPGGWNLIGRTPLEIVDLADSYFPISAGDSVTFYPIGEIEYQSLLGERL
jgi:inhibitor of KinA